MEPQLRLLLGDRIPTERALNVLVAAWGLARSARAAEVDVEHLLLGVAADGRSVGAVALRTLGVTGPSPADQTPIEGGPQPVASAGVRAVLDSAARHADMLGHRALGTEHLLLGMLGVPGDQRPTALVQVEYTKGSQAVHEALATKRAIRAARTAGLAAPPEPGRHVPRDGE